MDGTRRQTASASLISPSVGAPNVVPFFATCSSWRKTLRLACPKINGPHDATKSMYFFLSTSIICDPFPRRINFGMLSDVHVTLGLRTVKITEARKKIFLALFFLQTIVKRIMKIPSEFRARKFLLQIAFTDVPKVSPFLVRDHCGSIDNPGTYFLLISVYSIRGKR